MAMLSVSDSGVGIEPRHLGQIFEMFKQVDMGASRRKTGLGIGLALVRQLAELHGGRVEAHSQGVGRGAEFVVWLPVVGVDSPRPIADGDHAEALGGLRILLVDDEPELLEAFAEVLRTEGVIVTVADSADGALALARSESFDAIISDIAMPERDGYWLAQELRRGDGTERIPLVAVSGLARAADREAALGAGFDAHLGKPMDLPTLRRELLRAIERRARAG
jgi:two-component system CheB/CheR fusion protein